MIASSGPHGSLGSHRLLLKSLSLLLFFSWASIHAWNKPQLPQLVHGRHRHHTRELIDISEVHAQLTNTTPVVELQAHPSNAAEESALLCRAVRSQLEAHRCRVAKVYCQNSSKSVVNYLSLHFCSFREQEWVSVPVLVIVVIMAFYILAQTAEQHFSLVVARLATLLRLSPSMGGVTLLAFGNGAPDVFASIAAVWGGNARIGLGAIVSAGTFVTAFVVGFVVLAASPFCVNPISFIRDVGFYIVGVALLFLIYVSGEIYLWQAMGLVAFYIIFVIVVLCMDHIQGKNNPPKALTSDHTSGGLNPFESSFGVHTLTMDVWASKGSHSHASSDVESTGGLDSNAEKVVSRKDIGASHHSDTVLSPLKQEGKRSQNMAHDLLGILSSLVWCSEKNCHVCTGALKLRRVWQLPVEVILRCTIPTVDISKWNRVYAAANCVFCPLLLLYVIGSFVSLNHRIKTFVPAMDLPLWSIVLVESAFLGIVHFIFATEPPQKEQPFAIVLAFLVSVFWISFIAGELVGCLAALGIILELPPSLLGLTVLAWGNSMGDLVTDVAVARAGEPVMAIAGCFAGPLFNMLIGLGLALSICTASMHPSPYRLDYHPSIIVAFYFLFISLLGSLLVITCARFQVPRLWGFCLIGLYISFIVASAYIAHA